MSCPNRVKPLPAKIRVTLMNFDGGTLKNFVRDVNVAPLASRSYFDLRVAELLQGTDKKNVVVYCELLVNGKVVSAHDYFFAPFKELEFSQPTIITEVTRERAGLSIKLSSDKFAKAVYISVPDHDGFFSDNFFNLASGREVTVKFRSRKPLSIDEFRKLLHIRSVFDAF